MAKGVYSDWVQGDGLARVLEWVSEGREQKQIAELIGISPGTLYAWRKAYPEFDEAFKKGRVDWFERALPEVENAAYRLATGYTYKETTQELKDVGGTLQLVVTKVVTKHAAPNPVSNMYWLQNRAPDVWKDRRNQQPEADETGETGVALMPDANKGDA